MDDFKPEGYAPATFAGENTPVSGTALPLSVGDRLLDRYRVDAVFTGGMGILWAVTDVDTGRRYAIKGVKPADLESEAVQARFRNEAQLWIALDRHPHLVQAFWVVETLFGREVADETARYIDYPRNRG